MPRPEPRRLARFGEPPAFVDLVVGFGPSHLPMEWLYGFSLYARQFWDREWLVRRLQALVPTVGPRRVAWALTTHSYYSWDAEEIAGHEFVVRLTDPLVRVQQREDAPKAVRRLFLDARDQLADELVGVVDDKRNSEPSSRLLGHLGHSSSTSEDLYTTLSVQAPAFPDVAGSIYVARGRHSVAAAG